MPTNLPNSSVSSGLHYRLEKEEWLNAWANLKPAEIKLLFYLRTLAPFEDSTLHLEVDELANTLNVHRTTISRALDALTTQGYIDAEVIRVRVKVHAHSLSVPPDTTCAAPHQPRSPRTTSDRPAPAQPEPAKPETSAKPEPEAFSTEPQFVPEQTFKKPVNNRSGLPTVESLNKEETGTVSPLAQLIPEQTGVSLNPALRSVIEEVEMRYPEESYNRVHNAITAYIEQKASVRNPQAFISAALRRGFTSNQAKKNKRERTTEKPKRTNLPPAPAVPQILDLSGLIAEIQITCQTLGITVKQALERFGRAGRSLADLTDIDLSTLRREMAGWT